MLDETRRFNLIDAFKESHGQEIAMALAESLFSTEFATKADIKALNTRIDNCATKADIKALEARLDARIDNCATKAELKAEVEASANRMIRWFVTTMLAVLALVLTAGGIATGILLHTINNIAP